MPHSWAFERNRGGFLRLNCQLQREIKCKHLETGSQRALENDRVLPKIICELLTDYLLECHQGPTSSGTNAGRPASSSRGRGRGRSTGRPVRGVASRSQSRKSASARNTASENGSETGSRLSQMTSRNPKNYRYVALESANVVVDNGVPPKEVQEQIDAVLQRITSQDEERVLRDVATSIRDKFAELLMAGKGEDDLIEPFFATLSLLFSPGKFSHARKVDWLVCLKPVPVRFHLNYDLWMAPENTQTEAHPTARALFPTMRSATQANAEYSPPECSLESEAHATDETPLANELMPPPPRVQIEPCMDFSPIKTPRPDFAVGLSEQDLYKQLHRHEPQLKPTEAKNRLRYLQQMLMRREPGGQQEPLLCSEPTRSSTGVRPIVRPCSAGAGVCALKILRDLDDLANKASALKDVRTPGFQEKPRLVFSISTQGPVHELWAHYTVVEDTEQKFHMSPVGICRATLFSDVLPWLRLVNNVARWGAGEYSEDVVKKLGNVLKMGII
ncbi:hypothetical protein MMC22_001692 [Lobaria immixta]|nr:hypothetical protein [Lobaria immixta]